MKIASGNRAQRTGRPALPLLVGVVAILVCLAVAVSLITRYGAEEGSFQSSAPTWEATVVYADAGVRVRETPGPEGATLGALRTGERVRILEGLESIEGKEWVKVSWLGGRLLGWFPLRYLQGIRLQG